MVIEVFVGVSLAGLILALAIPLLSRNDLLMLTQHVEDYQYRRARRRCRIALFRRVRTLRKR